MRIKTAFQLFILSCAVGAGAGGGNAYGEFMQHKRDFAEAKENAILHNCGAYNAKTGVFGWVTQESAEDIVLADPDIARAMLAALPTPQRKPKVPK